MKSTQFRHRITGEIVTQIPIMDMHHYEPVADAGTIFDDEYRIFCEVSGGITGYNTAYLKASGKECRFTKDEAETRASELTARMNKPHSRATFKYTPELA